MKKNLRTILFSVSGVLVLAAAALLWHRYASPTRIAFVNYPEYVLAPLLDQEINASVEAVPLRWNEKSGEELKHFDCVIFFGMGLQFTERQQQLLSRLKLPVYTTSATRRETALNTLTAEQEKTLRAYLSGGRRNFRRMLDYIRYEIDGKRWYHAPKPAPPEKPEHRPFFHIQEEDSFKTFHEYLAWYRRTGRYRENAARICLLSGNGGGALGDLIAALEKKGLNVIGINGFWNLPALEKAHPDLVIYQPHGRLGEKAVETLKKLNVPLLCPIKVGQEYEVYLRDQRGMTGGMLSQSITMPELDGGTVPFVLSALYRNKRGLLEFRTIPDRLERFAELVRKMTDLKRKKNAEKKIAIVYYSSIGKEAATAGLGISESVLNVLKRLRSAGFTTGPLPETAEELNREIEAGKRAFGTNAGRTEAETGIPRIHTVTIRPDEYRAWVKRSMPDDLYQTVTERYGEFPGKSYRTPEGSLALGCIRFGNIILMPQSLPGEGDDESKLIHGVKTAPPHTYIATYLYIRHGFQADALMHFGTHGSLEFTPWKQVALSSYDWPDVLIGEIPHFYLYIINNIGEAQIAKRRSYAVMLSHLTPPFMTAEGYGAITQLQEKMELYESADNPMLKAEYAKSIVSLAAAEHYDRDLKLSSAFRAGKLNEEDLTRLHNFLHEIRDSKVNRGLYVLGRPYTDAEADETAILMTVDSIADELFQADLKAGKVREEQRRDLRFYSKHYLSPARVRAKEALLHPEKFKAAAQPPFPRSGDGMNAGDAEIREMMQSGRLPDGREMPPAMAAALRSMRGKNPMPGTPGGKRNGRMRRPSPKPAPRPEEAVFRAKQDLLNSTEAELRSIVNAFSGGYLSASPGGDPVLNPATVPTGKNLYGIDPERTPTRESYAVGKQLAEELIAARLKATGSYPKKVGFSLWGGEFIRTQGTNIAEIFHLLGVEPVWDSRGRVQDVRRIPLAELKRPRIDVVIQTSGQFRGAATSRMRLIDKAVRLAAEDPDSGYDNHVRDGSLEIIRALISNGMSPDQAKALGTARLFGGVNGSFGTGVTGMAQNSGKWEDTKGIAELYLNNMGALYTEGHWGEHIPGVFRAALANTDAVVQSRSSNSWGPLSLDHVYEFTGGLSLVARHVTGKDPGAYFNDLRTPGRAKVQEAGEAAMIEARSTVLNPKYISEMMKEGAAGTGTFVEVFRNTFGWEVMKPDMIEDHLWQEYKEVYVDDKLQLKIREYFENRNPSALHEMTGVLLEAVRKKFWNADAETVRRIAETHAELMKKFDLPPVRNEKLRDMIRQNLRNPALRQAFDQQVAREQERRQLAEEPRRKSEQVTGRKLKEQTLEISPVSRPVSRKTAGLLIGGIILLALLAVLAGRRRKESAD